MTAPKPEDVEASYGFVAQLARQVPEVGAILNQARAESWTTDRFNMAVANTNWWKSTPPERRQWFIQQISDPAGAAAAMRTGASAIEQIAGQLGFGANVLTREKAQELWLHGQLSGDNEQQIRAFIFDSLAPLTNGMSEVGGEYGALIQQARALAGAYGYNATEEEVRRYAGGGLTFGSTGQAGLAGWQSKLKSYAAAKFAPFADRIAQGETVADIAAPYVEAISSTLEINPKDVGLDDQYVQKWLQGTAEAGKPPAATAVWQAQQELRKDPRWQNTRNAWDAAAKTATTIGKAFGMVG